MADHVDDAQPSLSLLLCLFPLLVCVLDCTMSRSANRARPAPLSVDEDELSSSIGVRRGAPTPVYTPSTNAKPQQRQKVGGDEPPTWSEADDAALHEAIKEHGEGNWAEVAEDGMQGKFPPEDCQARWDLVKGPAVKGPWTRDEDVLLNTLVQRYGPKKWSVIAAHVPGRKGKQCRERWKNHLDNGVKKTPWSAEEDRLLLQIQQEVGNRWCEIAKKLPGRPENAVKNRWNSLMNRKWTQSMQSRSAAAAAGGGDIGTSYDDETAMADMFGDASPFQMLRSTEHGNKGVGRKPSMASRVAEPAMGASLHIGSDDERHLVRDVYETLGRSGRAPILPPTPAESGCMGARDGKGVLVNSPTQWGGRAMSKKNVIFIDSSRIMSMTEGFLRNELQRKHMYDGATQGVQKKENKPQNILLTGSKSSLFGGSAMLSPSGGLGFNFNLESALNSKDMDDIGNEIGWDMDAMEGASTVVMPDQYDVDAWDMEKQSLRDSVKNLKVSGSNLFRTSLGDA